MAGFRDRRCGPRPGIRVRRPDSYDHDELAGVLDEVVPSLVRRGEPLLLEVAVAPDETFAP